MAFAAPSFYPHLLDISAGGDVLRRVALYQHEVCTLANFDGAAVGQTEDTGFFGGDTLQDFEV